MAISRAKKRQLPAWVFPGGLRPERAPRKRPSQELAPSIAAPDGNPDKSGAPEKRPSPETAPAVAVSNGESDGNGVPEAKAAKTGDGQTAGAQARGSEAGGAADAAPATEEAGAEESPDGMDLAGEELAPPESAPDPTELDGTAEAQNTEPETGPGPGPGPGVGDGNGGEEFSEAPGAVAGGENGSAVGAEGATTAPVAINGHAAEVPERAETNGDGGVEELEVLHRAHGPCGAGRRSWPLHPTYCLLMTNNLMIFHDQGSDDLFLGLARQFII